MKIEKSVDYLQFTSDVLPRFLGKDYLQRRPPIPFYKTCNEYPCGTLAYLGNVNSEKYLIQMPGKACEEYTINSVMLPLTNCFEYGGKVSRLDIAVTVDGREALEAFKNVVGTDKLVSTRFEQDEPKLICSASGEVETIYVGDLKKRGKKGIFRAYDKGIESGLGVHFTRFELEIRRKSATTAAHRLNYGHDMGDIIRQVVDVPSEQWWVDIMGAKSEKLPRFPNNNASDPIARRWHWLNEQVAPCLAKLILIEAKQGTRNYEKFHKRVISEGKKAKLLDSKAKNLLS